MSNDQAITQSAKKRLYTIDDLKRSVESSNMKYNTSREDIIKQYPTYDLTKGNIHKIWFPPTYATWKQSDKFDYENFMNRLTRHNGTKFFLNADELPKIQKELATLFK